MKPLRRVGGNLPGEWARGALAVGSLALVLLGAGGCGGKVGVAGATYVFCLPGSPGACRDAWDEILQFQLDYRYRPCNFVEIIPRLEEHLRRPKAAGSAL